MAPKPYHKKWLSISETLASLTGDSDAKTAICNAIADARLHISFLVPQLDAAPLSSARIRFELADEDDGSGAKSLAGIPVRIPGRLPVERFADLAQPIAWWWPWFFGAVSQRPDLAYLWALAELELLADDVKKVLGGAAPSTSEFGAEVASDYEGAIEWLRAKLASAKLATGKDIVKHDTAQRACRRYFGVSMTGFDKRVWVPARIKAGLEPVAKAGRKPKKKPRGHS